MEITATRSVSLDGMNFTKGHAYESAPIIIDDEVQIYVKDNDGEVVRLFDTTKVFGKKLGMEDYPEVYHDGLFADMM